MIWHGRHRSFNGCGFQLIGNQSMSDVACAISQHEYDKMKPLVEGGAR
jgi:hypothetical protein